MPAPLRPAAAILAAALFPSAALACLWDADTVRQEQSRFPTVLELITGKFLRHSPEFYEWRIRDRLTKLQSDPGNLAYLDDLAVAYDKIGKHEQAIETMRAAEKLRPDRYETEANLGTFLIHAGRPEEGLPHIDRAIAINPDAHFGREKYQKYLVEYVVSRRVDGKTKLPLARVELPGEGRVSFTDFLRRRSPGGSFEAERPAALKGLLGIMRFGDFTSPVVLEALGGILAEDPGADARQLAARAYLMASYRQKDEGVKAAYREMARAVLPDGDVEGVEKRFYLELGEAVEWYNELRQSERTWIREGKDPEAEFDKLYTGEPRIVTDGTPRRSMGEQVLRVLVEFGLVALAVFAVALVLAWLVRRAVLAPLEDDT